MIRVHHLNNSRSQRVLWLLEELGTPYEIVPYQRDAKTMLAPPELRAVHPLGKSPVIADGDLVIAETGAIMEYLVEKHGGRMAPKRGTPAHRDYLYWLHYAEGSLMSQVLLNLYVGRVGEAGKPVLERVHGNIALHLDHVDAHLAKNRWFAGEELTAADMQMSFPLEALKLQGLTGKRAAIADFIQRAQSRPAYRRALERGGPYQFAS